MTTVVLEELSFEQCSRFALESTSTRQYQDRGQTNSEKIMSDILIGAMAEFGLFQMGICNQPPNLAVIYDTKQKSDESDLIGRSGVPIHSKACTVADAKKYGASWIFDYAPSSHRHSDHLFHPDRAEEEVYLTTVNPPAREITVDAIVLAGIILEYSTEPRVKKLRFAKVALELKNIPPTEMIR